MLLIIALITLSLLLFLLPLIWRLLSLLVPLVARSYKPEVEAKADKFKEVNLKKKYDKFAKEYGKTLRNNVIKEKLNYSSTYHDHSEFC